MWLEHLLNLISTAASIFFVAIGTTFLGRLIDVAFAVSVVVVALDKERRDAGWAVMLNRLRQEYAPGIQFALWCALILYGPVVIWSVAKAVYDDHQFLVTHLSAAINDKNSANARFDALESPALSAIFDGLATAPTNKKLNGTIVTAMIVITNNGAPSIVQHYAIFAKLRDGENIRAAAVIPLAPGGTLKLNGRPGTEPREMPSSDYLPRKAMDNPIPRGGAVSGYIMVAFPDYPESKLEGAVIRYTFEDISGKRYELDSRPLSSVGIEHALSALDLQK